MNFYINEILKESSTGKKYTILWIDHSVINSYIIELDNDKALPIMKKISELREGIISSEWIKEKGIPYSLPTDKYEQKHAQLRDNAWLLIRDLVNKEPHIYEKKYRSSAINKVCETHSISYHSIRKYLYRYWSRGKTINSLLPDYNKSGALGKERTAGEKKRGRPRKYQGTGINVDEATKEVFRMGIKKYYLTPKQNSLTVAYKLMLREFYTEDIYYSEGTEKVILKDEIPTLEQFKYWFNKEIRAHSVLKARKGEKRYEKDHRAVLGTSLSEVFGPGSRYQIDATIGDIYLVSEINNNWIIGRPVIYIVVDVFSRLVVGMNIGLEGPSWMGAVMALTNVVTNKKSFCAEYGIEIDEEDWPCNHLPEILLADKGEFAGYNPERLVNAFNLHVENAAAYRADWKGIVENKFKTIQEKIKPFVPGYIDVDFQERGSRDYRLDATLTLREFNQIMIKQILKYNTSHYMETYIREKDLVADDVLPIPLELWNWGIENRTGKLRYYSEELVKIQLLPKDSATVNYQGIQFKGITYSCEKAIKESWFENARMRGSWKIKISYDPRNMSNVYFINELGNQYEVCHISEVSKRFLGLSLEEITFWRSEEKRIAAQQNHKQIENDINLYSDIEAVVRKASKRNNDLNNSQLSKSEKTKFIRINRYTEIKNQNQTTQSANSNDENKIISLDTLKDTNPRRTGVQKYLNRRKETENE